jgi:hypothetical protein
MSRGTTTTRRRLPAARALASSGIGAGAMFRNGPMLTATRRHLRPRWLGSAADLPQNCRRTTQSAEKFPPLHANPSQRSADGIVAPQWRCRLWVSLASFSRSPSAFWAGAPHIMENRHDLPQPDNSALGTHRGHMPSTQKASRGEVANYPRGSNLNHGARPWLRLSRNLARCPTYSRRLAKGAIRPDC